MQFLIDEKAKIIVIKILLIGIDGKFTLALIISHTLLNVIVRLEVSKTCLLLFLLHFLF